MSASAKDSRRTQRLSSLLRAELARLFLHEVSDPVLTDVVVTEVELSKDLKHAKVFYSFHEGSPARKEAEVNKGFGRVQGYLKRRLAEELELRFVPELRFIVDTHVDDLSRLMKLMDEVNHPHP